MRLRVLVLLTSLLASTSPAEAQRLGTFRWQLAPFCNVLTLTVDQVAGHYVLSGTDDLCDAAIPAGVTGTANLNRDGTIGLKMTVVRPDGWAVGTSAAVSLGLSGTWRDEYGQSGTFLFAPGPVSGGRRPITLVGSFAIAYTAGAANQIGVSAFSYGRALDFQPSIGASNIIPSNAPSTATCPGTRLAPSAAPGQFCVYEGLKVNVGQGNAQLIIGNTLGGPSLTDRAGGIIFTRAAAAGEVFYLGSWAVSIP
jgi:hypothetical protein